MNKIKINKIEQPIDKWYMDDILKIVAVLYKKGYNPTLEQCEYLWAAHSDDFDAGWLDMSGNSDEAIFRSIKEWIEDAE